MPKLKQEFTLLNILGNEQTDLLWIMVIDQGIVNTHFTLQRDCCIDWIENV